MSPKKEIAALGQGDEFHICSSATPGSSHPETPKSRKKAPPVTQKEPRPETQGAIALELLRRRPGGWVGVHEILRQARCAAPHSVISDLRRRYGFRIRNRMGKSKAGVALSEYQLEEEAK